MILTGQEIEKQVLEGKITIEPFDKRLVNPNSYNYSIGPTLLELSDDILDPSKSSKYKEVLFDKDGFVLQPNKLYLASTFEKIGSSEYVTSLIGRSSVGRLGLFVQITADLGNLGAIHSWTLELKVVQPLRIYPRMRIGQVSFWLPDGDKGIQYDGKYHNYNEPRSSKMYEELTSKDYQK